MPDEVRKMDNKKCLLFIRGFNPVLDDKYKTVGHPMFSQSADGNGNAYVHTSLEDNPDKEPSFMFLNQKALEYYEGLKNKGEPVYIDTIPYEDFMLLGQFEMEKKRGVKACYGCQSPKESDTFLFLSGNFRCKDDGDPQGIRIKSFVVLLGKSVYNGM